MLDSDKGGEGNKQSAPRGCFALAIHAPVTRIAGTKCERHFGDTIGKLRGDAGVDRRNLKKGSEDDEELAAPIRSIGSLRNLRGWTG
jgi:hypothetical protein